MREYDENNGRAVWYIHGVGWGVTGVIQRATRDTVIQAVGGEEICRHHSLEAAERCLGRRPDGRPQGG